MNLHDLSVHDILVVPISSEAGLEDSRKARSSLAQDLLRTSGQPEIGFWRVLTFIDVLDAIGRKEQNTFIVFLRNVVSCMSQM